MKRSIRGKLAVILAAMVLGTAGGCQKKDADSPPKAQESADSQQSGESAETTQKEGDANGSQSGADADSQQSGANAKSPQTQEPDQADTTEYNPWDDPSYDPDYDPAKDGLEYAGPPASVQDNESVDTTSAQSGAAMGRYTEQALPGIEGLAALSALGSLEDGTLRVLGMADMDEGAAVWDSHDGGTTWEKTYTAAELSGVESPYCISGALSPDGAVFLCMHPLASMSAAGDGSSQYVYGKITADGTWQQVDLALPDADGGSDGYLYRIAYVQPGEILVQVLGGDAIYRMDDSTGELLQTYNEEGAYVGYFENAGEILYAFGSDNVMAIDCATGEADPASSVLTGELESDSSNLELMSSDTFPTVLCSGQQEGEVFYATKDGIYRFVLGGSVVEQVADGTLNSLAKPSVQLIAMLALKDGSFLIAVRDEGQIQILHYTYDASAPTVPDTELKVYSLTENRQIQQAISVFQARNPDYYVSYEVGMTGSDAVTASDALRTLNTEIMAGSGPDILILDGMPAESYIRRGILLDISDVLQTVKETDGLWENITNAFETDGKLYAVPSRFRIPVLAGNADTLSRITDLASLADEAQRLREEDGDVPQILEISSLYWTVRAFYEAYSNGLVDADGAFQADAVRNFIEQMKRLLDLNHYTDVQAGHVYSTEAREEEAGYDFTTVLGMPEFLQKLVKLGQANIDGAFNLENFLSGAKLDNSLSYIPFRASGASVFVPNTVVGISSQSEKAQDAKEFVRFLFSRDAQAGYQEGGFPVNRAAFEAQIGVKETESLASTAFSYEDEDGNIVDYVYEVTGLADEEKEKLRKIVETLDTPSLTDAVIEELVVSQTAQCLAGRISLEEAVTAVSQKMSLYLQE